MMPGFYMYMAEEIKMSIVMQRRWYDIDMIAGLVRCVTKPRDAIETKRPPIAGSTCQICWPRLDMVLTRSDSSSRKVSSIAELIWS